MELKKLLPKEFIKELDPNLKYFVKLIREDLRDENDCVIGVVGYPGMGKSNDTAIISMLIDWAYSFEKNICFIPTSDEISKKYLELPMYSVLHIDEASRGLHKQKWYDKVQQTLNELYETERENHYLCTMLIMPRFQNFSENFRNFRIKYKIFVPAKGIAIVYKKDEDPDAKDPWHIDENYKMKQKKWRGKRLFERGMGDFVRMEQLTKNYLFYFKIPVIPKEIWEKYQELKKGSRIIAQANKDALEMESYQEKMQRERKERWAKINEMKTKGHSNAEIGAVLGCSSETIRRNLRSMEAYDKMHGNPPPHPTESSNIIYNHIQKDKSDSIPSAFDKI